MEKPRALEGPLTDTPGSWGLDKVFAFLRIPGIIRKRLLSFPLSTRKRSSKGYLVLDECLSLKYFPIAVRTEVPFREVT